MTWNPITNPVDFILLASEKSPGIAEIRGADSPRRVYERNGYGFSGATVIVGGILLSHFSVWLRLYTEIDWDNWHAWKHLVDRAPPGQRQASQSSEAKSSGVKGISSRGLDIWHPILEQVNIRSVVVENVLAPDQTDDGEWSIEIKMIEFRQPVFAMSKPEAAKATPVDPVEQRIGDLTDQFQSLAGPP